MTLGALIGVTAPAVAAQASPHVSSTTSSPTQPPPAAAATKATFGIAPATNGKPSGLPILQVVGTPYATFTNQVAIVNNSLKPYTFDVYATDEVNDSHGAIGLLPTGKKPTDVGAWLTLGGAAASGSLTVQARSYVVVPVAGKIPGNASPGDHVGAVVVDLTTVGKRGNLNVKLHQRVGLTTFVRVAGDAEPGLAIEHLAAGYHNNWNPIGAGSATVTYRIHNTGNLVMRTTQKVTISGLFGKTATATPKAIPLLLPGGFAEVTVPMSGVAPEIWMTAKVQLTPRIVNNPGDPAIGIKPTSATTTFWAVPWVLIGIIVALLVGGFFGWRWLRKRRTSSGRHSAPKSGSRETVGASA